MWDVVGDMLCDVVVDVFVGKVVVVFGVLCGIGCVCVFVFVWCGVNVVVVVKSVIELVMFFGMVYGVVCECDVVVMYGARVMGCVVNLLDEASILACVARAKVRYGCIDVLVNNVSVLWW